VRQYIAKITYDRIDGDGLGVGGIGLDGILESQGQGLEVVVVVRDCGSQSSRARSAVDLSIALEGY
jgi:hypothetical protein